MNVLKYVWLFIIFFYYNFNFFPKCVPREICIVIYNIIPLIYLLKHHTLLKDMVKYLLSNTKVLLSILLLVVSHLWGIAVLVLNNHYDYSFLYTLLIIVRGIYINMFLILLIYKNVSKTNVLTCYIKYYVLSCVLYVAATACFVLNPDMKLMWSSLIHMTDRNTMLVEDEPFGYTTRFGLKGFSGFQETTKCSMAVIMLLFLLCKITSVKWLIVGLLCLVGNFFYGRVGIIGSCLSVVVFVFFTQNLLRFKYVKAVLAFILTIFFLIFYVIPEGMLQNYYTWVTGPLIAFVDGLSLGHLDFGHSGNTLVDWYEIPNTWTLIVGDGGFTNSDGSYYNYVDAGFMRSIYYFGLIGSIAYYLSYIVLLFAFLKKGDNKNIKAMCYSFFVVFMLIEFKGSIFVNFYPMILSLIIMFELDQKYCIDARRISRK